jgi:hypothetical protein
LPFTPFCGLCVVASDAEASVVSAMTFVLPSTAIATRAWLSEKSCEQAGSSRPVWVQSASC